MRELLMSKAKRINDGKWIEGFYVEQYGCFLIYLPEGVDSEYGFDNYHVDPATVCSFTNKNDKNGYPVWENDIVREGCNGLVGKVIWDNDLCTYRIDGLGEDYTIKDADIEWKVIGNAFDNPELLKKERMSL